MKNFKHLFLFAIALSFFSFDANAQAYNMGDYWILRSVEMSQGDQDALKEAMSQIDQDLFNISITNDGRMTNYGSLCLDDVLLAEVQNGNDWQPEAKANWIIHTKVFPGAVDKRLITWEKNHANEAITQQINDLLSKYEGPR